MTIIEKLERVRAAAGGSQKRAAALEEMFLNSCEVWSGAAAQGYAAAAAENIGIPAAQVGRLLEEMERLFEVATLEEAEAAAIPGK